jgi:hypothetical protein
MRNYKALKSASKVSVAKVKVVDKAANEDAGIEEQSHEELQVSSKRYDSYTGEVLNDSVRAYSLLDVKSEVDRCKSDVAKIQARQADWEQLETDLKAL